LHEAIGKHGRRIGAYGYEEQEADEYDLVRDPRPPQEPIPEEKVTRVSTEEMMMESRIKAEIQRLMELGYNRRRVCQELGMLFCELKRTFPGAVPKEWLRHTL
jgi:hypothetical protein